MTLEERQQLYKDSIFLPKTDFDIRAGLPQKEPAILAKWDSMDLFKRQREQSKDWQPYVLHDGPPYANGHIHMGHAVNKILKDVINRIMQTSGRNAHYVPGWDCHGLPIEWKIEEKYREQGKNKDEVPILEFRQECREFARHWIDVQAAEFKRMGVIGNWENPYLTMTNAAESRIATEIHKFALNGQLYRGVKPVMWSVVEQTALAEAEVEYKEHKSVTVWVRFPIVSADNPSLSGADVVIWTTTPWTLPSNRALAYGQGIDYAIYEVDEVKDDAKVSVGDRLVLAVSLADDVKEKAGVTEWSKKTDLSASDFAGAVCAHPLSGQGYDFDVPMLEGDFVTDDQGTGFVHIAPGHGEDDFYLGQRHGIEITDNVSDDGLYRDHVPLFAGLEVYTQKGEMGAGNFAVIKAISEAGKLAGKGSLRHEYPHSWRSKAPVIFRTTAQWFISMESHGLRDTALKAIADTKWIPERGETRIRSMIEQRPDWCISRQRSWGVPIALFVNKQTHEVLKDEEVFARIGHIFEDEGADAWWARDPKDFLGDKYNADDYDQIFDIVDVWFESGSTHAFVLEDRNELQSPADLYLEGSDQHRGWFHSSLLESCGTRGRAPYNAVLTHGFVLDEKGMKMSKSLGNIVAPQDMIDQYGADILRLWTVLSNYSEDIRIGEATMKGTVDIYKRVRNTLRFMLGAMDGLDASELIDLKDNYNNLPELEKWVLNRLHVVDQQVKSHIESYTFGKIAHLLYTFCSKDLSSFYFDIRKDRLYCDRPDMFERRVTRTVIKHIFDTMTGWLAPFLSFTAEEAWAAKPQGLEWDGIESVHLKTFTQQPSIFENASLAAKWDKVIEVRDDVLAALEVARKEGKIKSSLEAAPIVSVSSEIAEAIADIDMAEVCITSALTLQQGEQAVEIILAEGTKCQRCWKILPDVGSDPDYPEISLRDAEAVRYYVSQDNSSQQQAVNG